MNKIQNSYQTFFAVIIVNILLFILPSMTLASCKDYIVRGGKANPEEADHFEKAVASANTLTLVKKDTLTLTKEVLKSGYENWLDGTVVSNDTKYKVISYDLCGSKDPRYRTPDSDYRNNFKLWPEDIKHILGYRVTVNNGEEIKGKQYYFFWKIDNPDLPGYPIIFSFIVNVLPAPPAAQVNVAVSHSAAAAVPAATAAAGSNDDKKEG